MRRGESKVEGRREENLVEMEEEEEEEEGEEGVCPQPMYILDERFDDERLRFWGQK